MRAYVWLWGVCGVCVVCVVCVGGGGLRSNLMGTSIVGNKIAKLDHLKQ